MTELETFDFAALLEEPVWRPCVDCKRDCNAERCWDCTQAHERALDLGIETRAALRTIPERYRWADRAHPLLEQRVKLPNVRRELARILAVEQPVVTLVGTAGAGKSSLAAALMRASGDVLRAAMWASGDELAETSYGEATELARRAVRLDLLVIDELRDPVTPGKRSALAGVILRRHERTTARTIVTTGMTSEQIAEAFGDGVKRRLAAADCAHVVPLNRCRTCKHEHHEGVCEGKVGDQACHCPKRGAWA